MDSFDETILIIDLIKRLYIDIFEVAGRHAWRPYKSLDRRDFDWVILTKYTTY